MFEDEYYLKSQLKLLRHGIEMYLSSENIDIALLK